VQCNLRLEHALASHHVVRQWLTLCEASLAGAQYARSAGDKRNGQENPLTLRVPVHRGTQGYTGVHRPPYSVHFTRAVLEQRGAYPLHGPCLVRLAQEHLARVKVSRALIVTRCTSQKRRTSRRWWEPDRNRNLIVNRYQHWRLLPARGFYPTPDKPKASSPKP